MHESTKGPVRTRPGGCRRGSVTDSLYNPPAVGVTASSGLMELFCLLVPIDASANRCRYQSMSLSVDAITHRSHLHYCTTARTQLFMHAASTTNSTLPSPRNVQPPRQQRTFDENIADDQVGDQRPMPSILFTGHANRANGKLSVCHGGHDQQILAPNSLSELANHATNHTT